MSNISFQYIIPIYSNISSNIIQYPIIFSVWHSNHLPILEPISSNLSFTAWPCLHISEGEMNGVHHVAGWRFWADRGWTSWTSPPTELRDPTSTTVVQIPPSMAWHSTTIPFGRFRPGHWAIEMWRCHETCSDPCRLEPEGEVTTRVCPGYAAPIYGPICGRGNHHEP